MKRRVFALLLTLISLNFAACNKSKDVPPVSTGKTFLIKTITSRFASGAMIGVDEFTYDSKNRIIRADFDSGLNMVKYTYDDSDRLIKLEFSDTRGDADTYLYTYTENKIKNSSLQSDGSLLEGETYDLQNNRVIKETTTGRQFEFDYDSRGNVITVRNYFFGALGQTVGPLIYDDKKNPFSMVVGLNVHLTYSQYLPYYNTVNNVTGGWIGTTSYTYNADGFPVTSHSFYTQSEDVLREYTYIVK
jgi:YD repeat-containing protein